MTDDRAVEGLERFSQRTGYSCVKERRVEIGYPHTHRVGVSTDRAAEESRQRSALRSREADEREFVARNALLESGA